MSQQRASERVTRQSHCTNCAKAFPVRPGNKGTYCSRSCHYEHRRKVEFDRRAKPCVVCGVRFAKSPARSGPYCSRACFAKARLKEKNYTCPKCSGLKAWAAARCQTCYAKDRTLRDPAPCRQCGHSVSRSPAQWAASARRFGAFCSHACFGKFVTGPQNLAYIDGSNPAVYAATWRTARKAALNRDGFACILCGSSEPLEVHHIDGTTRNDELDNLATLCIPCHRKVHAGAVNVNGSSNRESFGA